MNVIKTQAALLTHLCEASKSSNKKTCDLACHFSELTDQIVSELTVSRETSFEPSLAWENVSQAVMSTYGGGLSSETFGFYYAHYAVTLVVNLLQRQGRPITRAEALVMFLQVADVHVRLEQRGDRSYLCSTRRLGREYGAKVRVRIPSADLHHYEPLFGEVG